MTGNAYNCRKCKFGYTGRVSQDGIMLCDKKLLAVIKVFIMVDFLMTNDTIKVEVKD